jgi:transcriptional regulator with GAF, ATPase, and Fis domain
MLVKEKRPGAVQDSSLTVVLAELSSRCLQAAAPKLDSAIDECQQLICERLSVDHSELWQAYDETDDDALVLSHLHRRANGAHDQPTPRARPVCVPDQSIERQYLPFRTSAKAFFPWTFGRAWRGETVVVSTLDELPTEAGRDRETFTNQGIRSVVLVPLLGGERLLGLLAFAMTNDERRWSDVELRIFRLTAHVFATALARMRTDQNLHENQLRLSLATASVAADWWDMDPGTGAMHLGELTRKLLSLELNASCEFEKFLSHVHADDLESVRSALDRARQLGLEVSLEFRLVVAGGQVRWIRSRWRMLGIAPAGVTRLVGVSVDITDHKVAEQELRRSIAEVKELKERLKAESEYVRSEIKVNQQHTHVVGQSRGIRRVLQQVEQVAPVNCPVLITGESGTGKELIAQSIHRLSPRGSRALVIVNCAALPAGLVESELFGRERGAFTGALSSQAGRFELADQSTIFLDEIAELPLELQGKLLRVLQEGEYARLGSPKTRKVDVRVIAATNRDLAEEVRKQRFREDLFYRLSVFPMHLPPLRERPEDIPLLVFAFLEELSTRMGKRITKVPRRVMETLERHYWPGNIRELRNVIERGIIISTGDTLRIAFHTGPQLSQPAVTLAEIERQHILSTLERTDWHIKGPHGAAKILDLKPGTLYSRMRKLGVPNRRQKDGMAT